MILYLQIAIVLFASSIFTQIFARVMDEIGVNDEVVDAGIYVSAVELAFAVVFLALALVKCIGSL